MILQLKISLLDIKPQVWRRILVDDSITFYDLHHILQIAMGWKNAHLFDFKIGDEVIGAVDETAPENMADANVVTMHTLLAQGGIQFIYNYDFGDGWSHQLEVENVSEEKKAVLIPVCIEGERHCPPEDCGGPHRYEHLLVILKDKTHHRHDEIKRWTGKGFDPEKFDLKKINKMLPKFRSYARTGRK